MNDVLPTPAAGTGAQAVLTARYRSALAAPKIWNDTLDGLLSHRTVRAYLPDAPPAGTIETLVAAAQSAASSSNLQAWSVIAVENPERKARLAALAGGQKHILEAPLLLVWLADLNRLGEIAATQNQPAEALKYLEMFLLAAIDASLAAQNAVVAAESLGLGTVYIGAMRNKPAEVAAELSLPPNVVAVFGLLVGYADPARPASVKPRLPQAAVLFHEQYGAPETQHAAVAAYDERLRVFQAEQDMPLQDWSAQAAARVRDAQALHGREALREILLARGFGLK
jgi:nitroreductase